MMQCSSLEPMLLLLEYPVSFSSSNPTFEQVQHEVIHVVQQGQGQGSGISQPEAGSELYAKLGVMMGTGADASLHRDEVRSLFPPAHCCAVVIEVKPSKSSRLR